MNPTPQSKMLSLQVAGFPVPHLTTLRKILNALTATDPPWFAVEPGPERIFLVYVRPETSDRLAEIISQSTDRSAHALDVHFRSEAKRRYHDEGTLEIDDEAPVSVSQDTRGRGAYVQAWVWVDKNADYICDSCQAEWFPSELLPAPSEPPPPPQNAQPTLLCCPTCGSPCHPKRP